MAVRNLGKQLLCAVLDLVYPPHCVACGTSLHEEELPDAFFCASCLARLQFVGPNRCPKCGHELAEYAAVHVRCPSCEGKPLFFKSATAPFKYEGAPKVLILEFKLSRQVFLAGPLSKYLIAHLESAEFMPLIDAVIAVPLHWRRLLKRGYNQSQILADNVSQRFGRPLLTRCLCRTAPTPSQTSVSREKRMQHLRGVFAVRRPEMTRGKTLLLIDDVLTTGATCAECSRVLTQNGQAKAVYVATVARAMLQK